MGVCRISCRVTRWSIAILVLLAGCGRASIEFGTEPSGAARTVAYMGCLSLRYFQCRPCRIAIQLLRGETSEL